jgi:hypothetical protein
MTWDGQDRRERVQLTPEQIEEIAKKAVEIAFKEMYAEVGKSIVKKLFWIVGVLAVSLMVWLSAKGQLNLS